MSRKEGDGKRVKVAAVLFCLMMIFSSNVFGQANKPDPIAQLGEPTLLQQAVNLLPAVTIGGKEIKYDFGGDRWIAKVNGQNFMVGDCVVEANGDVSLLTLQSTHIAPSAIEDVIEFLQNIGVPLDASVADPLKTAAKVAGRLVKWIPLKGTTFKLEHNPNAVIPLRVITK